MSSLSPLVALLFLSSLPSLSTASDLSALQGNCGVGWLDGSSLGGSSLGCIYLDNTARTWMDSVFYCRSLSVTGVNNTIGLARMDRWGEGRAGGWESGRLWLQWCGRRGPEELAHHARRHRQQQPGLVGLGQRPSRGEHLALVLGTPSRPALVLLRRRASATRNWVQLHDTQLQPGLLWDGSEVLRHLVPRLPVYSLAEITPI